MAASRAVAAAAVAALTLMLTAVASAQRPNIVLIMADDRTQAAGGPGREGKEDAAPLTHARTLGDAEHAVRGGRRAGGHSRVL